MAEFDLYIDCDRSAVVTGADDSTIKVLPKFVQGDTILLRVFLLKGYDRNSDYTPIPTEGLTLQVAIGALAAGTIYASQYTWTESEDLSNPYFEATLALNTEEIDDALSTATSVDAWFEVKYLQDAVPTTVIGQTVKIYKALIEPTSVMPVATPTPLSAEAAAATYVKKDHVGPIYISSADGLDTFKLWVDNSTSPATVKFTPEA